MSPLILRRYRADRLLREEFEQLRGRVLGVVRSRLSAAGATLDASDLDAAYGQAWQGLHAAILEGRQIDSPAGWLALVTYRRAIDEHRARARARAVTAAAAFTGERAGGESASDDLASDLDDRRRLRSLLEALRGRLSERERQAATLCYLQGLSRAEAAARIGLSEARMRKLMDGDGGGRLGVAGKVGQLARTIEADEWCEQQGSLMRGFAYGILDPQGERYGLALAHSDQCSACRAYVLSLRGLAALLPPLPFALHLLASASGGAGAGAGAGAGVGGGAATGAGGGVGGGTGAATGGGAAGAGGGAVGAGAGATGAGATGAGLASGGWWLAGGPLGAKLAVGCLLAIGVGAGCAALGGEPAAGGPHGHSRPRRAMTGGPPRHSTTPASPAQAPVARSAPVAAAAAPSSGEGEPAHVAAPKQASHEFGPEQAAGSAGAERAQADRGGATAGEARAARETVPGATATDQTAPAAAGRAPTAGSAAEPQAQREFAPG